MYFCRNNQGEMMKTREAPYTIRLGDLKPRLEAKLKRLNKERSNKLTLHAQIREVLEFWI